MQLAFTVKFAITENNLVKQCILKTFRVEDEFTFVGYREMYNRVMNCHKYVC